MIDARPSRKTGWSSTESIRMGFASLIDLPQESTGPGEHRNCHQMTSCTLKAEPVEHRQLIPLCRMVRRQTGNPQRNAHCIVYREYHADKRRSVAIARTNWDLKLCKPGGTERLEHAVPRCR